MGLKQVLYPTGGRVRGDEGYKGELPHKSCFSGPAEKK